MKFIVRLLQCIGICVLLAGCSSLGIEPKKIDYKSGSRVRVPTLEIPPDLTTPTFNRGFDVPRTATATTVLIEEARRGDVQKTSNVLPEVDRFRIERAGHQRWLVIDDSPDKLWEPIKEFWQNAGFAIEVDMPEFGVMETGWAENRAKISQGLVRGLLSRMLDSISSTAERDRFRTRIEPGIAPGTTEIFVTHRGMQEIYITAAKDQTRWQPREPDPVLEMEMLRRLMVHFGTDQQQAAAVIAAAEQNPPERSRLLLETGVLEIQENFDRAWRRVGVVLDRVGFTVEDRDRSRGLYFVRYVDPESEGHNRSPGLLSRLAFWRGSPPEPQTQYHIHVKDEGLLTMVQVVVAEGGADSSETIRRILTLLHDQLR